MATVRDNGTREEAISRPLPLCLTEAAEADLAEIWSFVAVEAPEEIADRFLVALEGTLMTLREFPLSGVSREEFAPGRRVVFHGGYAPYYKPFPDTVVVIPVLHGAQEARVLAERGGFKV